MLKIEGGCGSKVLRKLKQFPIVSKLRTKDSPHSDHLQGSRQCDLLFTRISDLNQKLRFFSLSGLPSH